MNEDAGNAARAGQMSLHQRILTDIESRILSRQWPPGHRIPFEMELAEQYGCSRMTVNKALTQLARNGLIERRRKSGSYVSRPHGQSAVLEISDIRSEVEALGLAYGYRLLGRTTRKADPVEQERLGLTASAPVLELVALHLAGDEPFCFEERQISLDAVPESGKADFASTAPGTWLLAQVPWSAAEHRIRAIAADREIARALKIPAGAACLAIERRTMSEERYLTHVRLTYPGESHELVARFTPSRTR